MGTKEKETNGEIDRDNDRPLAPNTEFKKIALTTLKAVNIS
jgi:hypothetical protein